MLVQLVCALSCANNVGTKKGLGVKFPTPVARDICARLGSSYVLHQEIGGDLLVRRHGAIGPFEGEQQPSR